jgi:hypothetical protein
MRDLRLTYNFNYTKTDDDFSFERENNRHNGSLTWGPSIYFTARLSANQSKDWGEEIDEKKSRNYNLSMSSLPIPTLEMSVSTSRSEDYLEDDMTDATNQFSFYSTAQLYQDLQAAFNVTYSKQVEGRDAESINESLDLTARLRPSLTMNINQDFSKNLVTDSESYANRFELEWWVSRLMYITNSATVDWADDEDTSWSYFLSIGVTPNPKNRLNFDYGVTHTDGARDHSFSGGWSWKINRRFNYVLNGNYLMPDEGDDSWNFSMRLRYYYSN